MKIALRIVSIVCLISAVVLTAVQWQKFQQHQLLVPDGVTIAGIPVGGLTAGQARERIVQVYSTPLEMTLGQARVQVAPSELGFELSTEKMLSDALDQRPELRSFWDFLWNKSRTALAVPLQASSQPATIRAFLEQQIVPRYNQPLTLSRPIPGTWQFQAGSSGRILQVDAAVPLISGALQSPTNRTIDLPVEELPAPLPSIEDLQQTLQHVLDRSKYSGIAEIYLKDLQNDRSLHFAYRNNNPVPGDIAFTAASTMKIPIMLSSLRRTGEPTPEDLQTLFNRMVTLSENPPADQLMERIDSASGPLVVTSDLDALGLKNSFIAGYFYMGAPLLKLYKTPANERMDVNVDPDIYNQTTAGDMGILLEAVDRCARGQPNLIQETFGGDVSPAECQLMIDSLARNKTAVLLEAGVPEGTRLAHKHGWIEESDGLLHTMSDVGIVYTPGGNYVLNVFLYDQRQLFFDQGNHLIAEFSNQVYNFFNTAAPYPWIFGPTEYP